MLRRAPATAKINLALVVGAAGATGKHEVATILQRIALFDRIELAPAPRLEVRGFKADTLVRDALTALAREAGVESQWAVQITKRIPVAAGLGGGSSDAATALRLANETLPSPVPPDRLAALAAGLGSDVPFFLEQGPQLAEGGGTDLSPIDLPQDYHVLLILPRGVTKRSTAAVYAAFDERAGHKGFTRRRADLRRAIAGVERARDLAELPPNDLASSALTDELRSLGAFRADVSGAGPAVYGLFTRSADAKSAKKAIAGRGRSWITAPAWYG